MDEEQIKELIAPMQELDISDIRYIRYNTSSLLPVFIGHKESIKIYPNGKASMKVTQGTGSEKTESNKEIFLSAETVHKLYLDILDCVHNANVFEYFCDDCNGYLTILSTRGNFRVPRELSYNSIPIAWIIDEFIEKSDLEVHKWCDLHE